MSMLELSKKEFRWFTIYAFTVAPLIGTIIFVLIYLGYIPRDFLLRLPFAYLTALPIAFAIFAAMFMERFFYNRNSFVFFGIIVGVVLPITGIPLIVAFFGGDVFNTQFKCAIFVCLLTLMCWFGAKFFTPRSSNDDY